MSNQTKDKEQEITRKEALGKIGNYGKWELGEV